MDYPRTVTTDGALRHNLEAIDAAICSLADLADNRRVPVRTLRHVIYSLAALWEMHRALLLGDIEDVMLLRRLYPELRPKNGKTEVS